MAIAMQGQTLYAAAAGADLSSSLFLFAKVDTDGTLVLAGNSDNVLGVIVEGATETNPASVQLDGIGKVMLGDTVTAGDMVQSNADGEAVTVTSGVAVGMVLQGGSAGEIVPIDLT